MGDDEQTTTEYIAKMVATYTEMANEQADLLAQWFRETDDDYVANRISQARYVIMEQNKVLRFIGERHMKLIDQVVKLDEEKKEN